MPEHIVTLADHETRHLAKTGALLVVRPVVPQPENIEAPDEGFVGINNHGYCCGRTLRNDGPPDYNTWPDVVEFPVRCPWLPGDVLVCKEAAWIHKDIEVKRPPENPGVYYEDQVVTTLPAKAGSFPEHARRDRPRYALAAPSGPG